MSTDPGASRLAIETAEGRRVTAVGVVDAHTAGSLLDRLRSLGCGADVHLDLTGVEFIDSSGLRTIVTVHQELDAEDHRLQLHGVSDATERIIEITGLREHLHVVGPGEPGST